MKRIIISIVALVVAAATLIAPVSANGDVAPASSAYFSSYTTYIEQESGSRILKLGYDVTSVGSMQNLGAERMQVLRSTDRINWTIVNSFYSDDYPSMLRNSAGVAHAYSRTYRATAGYYYKIYVTYYAFKSTNNFGRLHAYSNVVYVS